MLRSRSERMNVCLALKVDRSPVLAISCLIIAQFPRFVTEEISRSGQMKSRYTAGARLFSSAIFFLQIITVPLCFRWFYILELGFLPFFFNVIPPSIAFPTDYHALSTETDLLVKKTETRLNENGKKFASKSLAKAVNTAGFPSSRSSRSTRISGI